MTVTRRTIRSIPHRSAGDTWDFIVDLLAPTKGSARDELKSISGIASSLISEEILTDSPMIVYGSGPRVRIYCLFHQDAIEGDKAVESSLVSTPTEGDWKLSLPCLSEDLAWVQKELKKKSFRITARDHTEKREEETESTESRATVDGKAFLNL